MRANLISGLILAASLAVLPAVADTAAELLQKGIYNQETVGDLDNAIAIYRQIVNAGSSPRDVAAQAQFRLAQSLLQKGDLGNAAQEFEKLARSYADYSSLVSRLASQAQDVTVGRGGRGPRPLLLPGDLLTEQQQAGAANAQAEAARARAALEEFQRSADELKFYARTGGRGVGASSPSSAQALLTMSFDADNPVTITGVIAKMEMRNPGGSITIDSRDGSGKRYAFLTAGASELFRRGLTMRAIQLGTEVTVEGLLAAGGQALADGALAASATTITLPDGRKFCESMQPCGRR
jgi:tetratricopeptide (TPR) repeat protein